MSRNIEDVLEWDKYDDDTINSTPSVYQFGRAVTILGGFSAFAGFIYTCVALSQSKRTAAAEKAFGFIYIVFGVLLLIGGIVWASHFETYFSDVADLDDDKYTACDALCALDIVTGIMQVILGSVWLYMSGLCGEDKFQDLGSVVRTHGESVLSTERGTAGVAAPEPSDPGARAETQETQTPKP